ncbi:response regulator transcription factor [Caulobacter hibisci]|uniref:Response regulator transcription factor n=1 Tax=Caulobacter hibisci TaxID=2035993 RepID=A0ABS0T4P6_9CAUL|nr:response regulator transcription factor [Caulobacter hibisci]MBI1686461.1 response regulator transcription factor [Caulobacter hibisci]
MSAPTVHIVDDDGSIRLALDSLFRSVGLETKLFGAAQDFFKSGHAHEPGCLVLDVRLPGVSGLDFQAQLNAADIRMPVVLMTGHGDIPMTVRGMKAGAVDFLAKPFRDQDMLDAVMAAIDRDQAQRAERSGLDEARRRYDTLTARERQVMGLVAAGLMNKQIAFEIGLSEITVKIHRSSAMRKMEARSMLEFVRMAELLGVASAT